jgi:hypothetical protein
MTERKHALLLAATMFILDRIDARSPGPDDKAPPGF